MCSQKSVGKYSAAKVLLELFDDEIRQWVSSVVPNLAFEAEPVLLDDFVKDGLFGTMARIGEEFGCWI